MLCTGARILLESLKREGVDLFFGYPGGAVIDILMSCPTIRIYAIFSCGMSRVLSMPPTAMRGLAERLGFARYVRPRCDQYCDGDCYGLQRFHPHGYFYGAGVHAAHRE